MLALALWCASACLPTSPAPAPRAPAPTPVAAAPSPRPPASTRPDAMFEWRAGADILGDMGGFVLSVDFDEGVCTHREEFEGGHHALHGPCILHEHDADGFRFTIDGAFTRQETRWGERDDNGDPLLHAETSPRRTTFEASWFDRLSESEQASYRVMEGTDELRGWYELRGGLVVDGRVYRP